VTDADTDAEVAGERVPTPGLHHVSAIAGGARSTVEFYTETLGLRFVKRTVNFDDEFMYHLYFGDRTGSPGTLFTLFPYLRGETGRVGKPQPTATAFAVPEGAATYWYDRLRERGVDVTPPTDRFGRSVVALEDDDGQPLELVETATTRPPATDAVPAEAAIRGLFGVTLLTTSVYHTAATLEVLGFELVDQDGDRVRYRAPGDTAAVVDVLDRDGEYGREGIGTVHHVAVRAGGTPLQRWRERLTEAGLEPTWVRDRRYFRSIYFREPGGVLFEVATDGPGMTVDEPVERLGESLQLPDQYEPDREMIEAQLPPIEAGE